MTPREHARLARELIKRCGGLREAAAACRVGKSVLSSYQDPHSGSCMAADVMADLEEYCGDDLYSREISRNLHRDDVVADLHHTVCELTEGAANLQRRMRDALRDGDVTPNEWNELAAIEREVEATLNTLKSTRRGLEAGTGKVTQARFG